MSNKPTLTHIMPYCGLPTLIPAVARLPGSTSDSPLGQTSPIKFPVAVMTLSLSQGTSTHQERERARETIWLWRRPSTQRSSFPWQCKQKISRERLKKQRIMCLLGVFLSAGAEPECRVEKPSTDTCQVRWPDDTKTKTTVLVSQILMNYGVLLFLEVLHNNDLSLLHNWSSRYAYKNSFFRFHGLGAVVRKKRIFLRFEPIVSQLQQTSQKSSNIFCCKIPSCYCWVSSSIYPPFRAVLGQM